jgi:hypothetical protein
MQEPGRPARSFRKIARHLADRTAMPHYLKQWRSNSILRRMPRTSCAGGISLAEAEALLNGFTIAFEDARRDYGETRIVAVGEIRGLEFVCVYTPRGGRARVISLRRANRKERDVYQDAKGRQT